MVAALAGCGAASNSALPAPGNVAAENREPKAFKAFCGPDDMPETGYQGQTPLADMVSERSQEPYFCGLRIVGHTDLWNRGENFQLARSQHCAYVSTLKTAWNVDLEDPVTTREPAGVAVIDVSDPSKPEPVGLLRDRGSLDPMEAMDAVDAPGRHVLVASDGSGGHFTPGPAYMDIYDVSNCAKPKLMATFQWPGAVHDLVLSSDGKRVYGAEPLGTNKIRVADISDLSKPRLQADMTLTLPDGNTTGCHSVELNREQTRLFCAGSVSAEKQNDGYSGVFNQSAGPTIWDVSEIAQGRAVDAPPFIGEADVAGQGWHHAVPAMINGRPYMVAANELSLGGCGSAFPRIWDISNEHEPKMVGEFRLEVQDHCAESDVQTEDRLGSYGSHMNDVDDQWGNTRLGLFAMTGAGFRVVDLRNPAQPREIAYYKPGANPMTTLAPLVHVQGNLIYQSAVTDACASRANWVPETGQIWFACMSNGFFVAELSPQAREYLATDPAPAQRP